MGLFKIVLNVSKFDSFRDRLLHFDTVNRLIKITKCENLDYIDKIVFMFVDGSHSYEYRMSDSKLAYNLVRRGGYILWHDYGSPYWPDVTEALNELYLGNRDFKSLQHIVGTSLCILQNR